MMRMSRQLLCVALVLCMLISLAPLNVFALETQGNDALSDLAEANVISEVIGEGVTFNPSETATDEMVAMDMGPGDPIMGDLYPDQFNGEYLIIEELYEALRLRKNEIYLYYCTSEELTEADLDELLITAAQRDFHYDGGDYLLSSIADYGYYAEVIQDGGLNYYIIAYAVAYFTTLEQEQELEAKILELESTILGDAVNEYQKIKAVHDYIVNNVELDVENSGNLENLTVHSAYAALFHGKATAQAYPMLFDRMLRLYHLGSRIIIGTIENVVFMWNIVRVNDVWYNVNILADDLDSTDAYFLKGSTDFPDGHQPADKYLTEDFMNSCPIAETAFVPEKAVSGNAGDNVTWWYNAITNQLVVSGSGRMMDSPQISYIQADHLSLVVEDGVTYIGQHSFTNREFEQVTIAGSVTEIGPYAFDGSAINQLTLNEGLVTIADGAFAHCRNLTEVKLPSTVEHIGTVAFYDTPVVKAEISANVTSIGKNAYGHETFEGYVVDENNTVYSSVSGALYNKEQTTLLLVPRAMKGDLVMPETVTVIGDEAFMNSGVSGIKLHEGITRLGKDAFRNSGLVAIELPSTMTEIPEGAFATWGLESIYIPASITVIGMNAFESCNIQNIYYGGTAEQWAQITIEDGNYSLNNATVHEKTHKVSGYDWTLDLDSGEFKSAYFGVGRPWRGWKDSIVSIELTANATDVPDGAFKNLPNLKTVRIDTNYLHSVENAFAGCTALTDVYYNESESKWKEQGLDQAFPDSPNMTVHYKALPTSGSWGDNAKWTYDEKNGVLVISGQGVITGENRSWEHWIDYVKVIVVEEGITEIGTNAFQWCSKAVRLVIGDGVTTIGENAFYACSSLQDITVPVSLQSVAADNLSRNYNEYADVHYKGTEEQWNAIDFHTGNGKFTDARIFFETACDHDMVIDFGKEATCAEEGLTMSKYCKVCNEVFAEQRVLPKAPHDTSWGVCYKCGTDFGEGYESVGEFGDGLSWAISMVYGGVFNDRKGYCLTIEGNGAIPDFAEGQEVPWSQWVNMITEVMIRDGVTSVGDRAFKDCVNLKSVNLPATTTSIGDYAFANCYGLTNVEIGKRVAEIGDHAFDGCFRLFELTLYGGVTTIGEKAFNDCDLYRIVCRSTKNPLDQAKIGSGNEVLLNATISFAQPVDFVYNPFTDVANADWFANPVLWAYYNGVTGGTSDTTFGPNNFCTRAQVVTFLYAAAGKPEVTTTDNPFVDVADNAWYLKPVLWAVENGITSGVDATHFGPDNTCTRAQVVTFLYAAAGKPEIKAEASEFDDVQDTDWFVKPVMWAKENDVTGGISAGMFGPNQTCTRAQVVTFLYKVYG